MTSDDAGRRGLVTVAAMTLAALLLRLHEIGERAVWLDESVSFLYSREPVGQVVMTVLTSDPHPPLYYVALHYWMELFGIGPVALRSLSAVFAALAVPAMYGVGRRLADTHRGGLYAAAFTAVAPLQVWAGQEARMYALLAFATALSFYAYLRLDAEATRRNRLLYAVSLAVLGYTHYYGLFTIAAHAVLVAVPVATGEKTLAERVQRWAPSMAGAGVLLLPVIVAPLWLVFAAGKTGQIAWLSQPGPVDLIDVVVRWFSASGAGPFYSTVALIGMATAAVALYLGDDPENAERECLGWVVVPLLLGFVLSVVAIPIFHSRYTVGIALGAYALIAVRTATIPARPARLLVGGGLIVCLLVGTGGFYAGAATGSWGTVTDVIHDNSGEEPTVASVPGYSANPVKYYTAVRGDDASFVSLSRTATASDIREKLGRQATFWLVVENVGPQNSQRLYKAVESGYDVVCVSDIDGVVVARVVPEGAAPGEPVDCRRGQ